MLAYNAQANAADHVASGVVRTSGYLWGADPQPLLDMLPAGVDRYDLLILSDLVFNHQQHGALLTTVKETMAADGQVRI